MKCLVEISLVTKLGDFNFIENPRATRDVILSKSLHNWTNDSSFESQKTIDGSWSFDLQDVAAGGTAISDLN